MKKYCNVLQVNIELIVNKRSHWTKKTISMKMFNEVNKEHRVPNFLAPNLEFI